MKNNGFAHVLVLLIVVLGIGVLGYFSWKGGYINFNPQSKSQQTVSPSLDPTAGWKTFKSEKYGFEIKFPSAAMLEITEDPCLSHYNQLPEVDYSSNFILILPGAPCGDFFAITVLDTTQKTPFDYWISVNSWYKCNSDNTICKQIFVDKDPTTKRRIEFEEEIHLTHTYYQNYPALKVDYVKAYGNFAELFYIQKEKQVYKIEYTNGSDDYTEQILSTFNFIE